MPYEDYAKTDYKAELNDTNSTCAAMVKKPSAISMNTQIAMLIAWCARLERHILYTEALVERHRHGYRWEPTDETMKPIPQLDNLPQPSWADITNLWSALQLAHLKIKALEERTTVVPVPIPEPVYDGVVNAYQGWVPRPAGTEQFHGEMDRRLAEVRKEQRERYVPEYDSEGTY